MLEQEKVGYKAVEEGFSNNADNHQGKVLSRLILKEENRQFANSPGISMNNKVFDFLPAFQDIRSGCSMVSRFADGRHAPVHILDGLPDEWIEARKPNGQVVRACPQIISGFLRDGRFYTREEASQAILNQDRGLESE